MCSIGQKFESLSGTDVLKLCSVSLNQGLALLDPGGTRASNFLIFKNPERTRKIRKCFIGAHKRIKSEVSGLRCSFTFDYLR